MVVVFEKVVSGISFVGEGFEKPVPKIPGGDFSVEARRFYTAYSETPTEGTEMLLVILIAAIAYFAGVLTNYLNNREKTARMKSAYETEIQDAWLAGFEGGWKDSSNDATNVRENYKRLFNPKF